MKVSCSAGQWTLSKDKRMVPNVTKSVKERRLAFALGSS